MPSLQRPLFDVFRYFYAPLSHCTSPLIRTLKMPEDENQLNMEGDYSSPSKFIYTPAQHGNVTQQTYMRGSSPQISPRTTHIQTSWTTYPQNTFSMTAHAPMIKRESAAELRDTPMMTSDLPYRSLSLSPTPRAQGTRHTLPDQHECPLHAHAYQRSPTGSTISFGADSASEYQQSLLTMLEELCTAAVKWYWNRTASRFSLSDLGERDRGRRQRAANFPYPPRRMRELHFMDYVGRIANLLWERARRDVITPRRAEMEAVEGMGRLYRWAERVVKAWEGRDETVLPAEDVSVALLAARDLCGWLGFEEGRIRCEEVYRSWGATAADEVE